MQNLHRHSSYSNVLITDSAASNEDYAKRAVELGHKVLSSVEHGWQGPYHQIYELSKKYELKTVIGAEAYWVKDRFEKDKSNHHICIWAKSNQGREALNDILSEANISGYYYRPRIDMPLILSLPPKDVVVSSACIAFSGYEDIDEIVEQFHDHFGSNFYLEAQYHNTDKQKDWSRHQLELSKKYNLQFLVGLDSHYVYPEESKLRDYILEAKNLHYEDEDGWFMDYPNDEEIKERFKIQGIFSEEQITQAMSNTDIALDFCDYDNVRIFTKDIKLPTLYPGLTKEEKDKKYSKLITKKFKEYMKNVPKDRQQEYFDGVKAEVKTYRDTGMCDYPLLDYAIVKDAVEHGGLITDTGRGSAVSYFTNTLCGFSKIDRFTSAIKLYPERFISTTRILQTKSLPDIDLNVGTPEIFEEAQQRVLGENHAVAMLAFGTLKKKSAFKLYARAKNMDFDLANKISEQISQYDEAVKNAPEEDKNSIDLYDYVDKQYEEYIEQSKNYWGVIADKKKAPSAYLLYDGDIRKEIGLIKCKSETTKKEYITCVIDGAVAENYKFLKNDILKVDVVLLIDKVFKRIGIEHFDVNTLIEKTKNDSKTWDIYANGYTIGINQVEQEGSKKKCMRYKPHNISELSAFVAAIRPGFKSMYSKFEAREDFSYGIPALDNMLRTEELPVSFIFFQEQCMMVLNYAGFPMAECYGAIKAIAKKHPEKVRPLKQQFIEGFRGRLINEEHLSEEDAQDNAEKVWTIINDNCGYSFNCVAGNTKIKRGSSNHRYVPTIEEMYKIRNDYAYAKETGHLALRKKYRRYGYGQALSMYSDGRIYPNRIVSIKESGVRQTYKITTKRGSYIVCTDNHKFPTPKGEVELKDLKVGDSVYCMGEYKHKYFDSSFTDGNYIKNTPQKGQQGFQRNENGASVLYLNSISYNKENKKPCEVCEKAYDTSTRFELHHKDFDRHNNCIDNYQWLCVSCHKKIHYQAGRTKRYENGIETYLDEIISIVPDEIVMVYDIAMDDPAHNFISESGLVTSNSSHAYSVALDGLYQAWQKAHYPYEFYETLLNHYTEKGNKAKVIALKEEMKKGFGIVEGKYKFRDDNRQFTADPKNNRIIPSLVSIKNMNSVVAQELYNLRDNAYTDFIDLLIDIKDKTSVNSRTLDILIRLDFFSEFGTPNELLWQTEIFNQLYGKKQFKVDKITEMGFLVEEFERFSQKSTPKVIKFEDTLPLIKHLASTIELPKTTIFDHINYELECLGYIQTTMPDVIEDIYVATAIKGKQSRIVTLYQLNSGATTSAKVRGKLFNSNPFDVGQIINIKEWANDFKWHKIIDEKGKEKWEQLDEKELLVTKYSLYEEKTNYKN